VKLLLRVLYIYINIFVVQQRKAKQTSRWCKAFCTSTAFYSSESPQLGTRTTPWGLLRWSCV